MSQNVGSTALAMVRTWHHISAKNAILGKLAVDVAELLMGKRKPVYDQAMDIGDYVIITNSRHIAVTGEKAKQKLYRHHTMYPGGLKEIKYEDMMQKKPDEIIRKAVSGMLPKNKFRDRRLERLLIYPEEEHPHEANIIKRYDLGDKFKDPKLVHEKV